MNGALGGMTSVNTPALVDALPLATQRAAVLNTVARAMRLGMTPGEALALLDMLGLREVAEEMGERG